MNEFENRKIMKIQKMSENVEMSRVKVFLECIVLTFKMVLAKPEKKS